MQKFCGILKNLSLFSKNLQLKYNFSSFAFNNRYILRSIISEKTSPSTRSVMDLASVVKTIKQIIPLELAETWDNTGLLIDPPNAHKISCILLTNDLTENVLAEALLLKANFILAYHPPIFSSMKLFQSRNWKDRIIMACIANGIAVYSPHTACDAIENGVNDWLISCFELSEVSAIKKTFEPHNIIEFYSSVSINLDSILSSSSYLVIDKSSDTCGQYVERYKLMVEEASTKEIFEILDKKGVVHVVPCKPFPHKSNGMGRLGKLTEPLTIKNCVQIIKKHAKLDYIRCALGREINFDTKISTVAVCAGSGATILKDVSADLYVTGEMSHHDILDAIHNNHTVILCEHSNSERGYLKVLSNLLSIHMPDVKMIISSKDKDPISIV